VSERNKNQEYLPWILLPQKEDPPFPTNTHTHTHIHMHVLEKRKSKEKSTAMATTDKAAAIECHTKDNKEQRQKTIKLCIYLASLDLRGIHISIYIYVYPYKRIYPYICMQKGYLNRVTIIYTRKVNRIQQHSWLFSFLSLSIFYLSLSLFMCVCVWQMGNWILRWAKTNPIELTAHSRERK